MSRRTTAQAKKEALRALRERILDLDYLLTEIEEPGSPEPIETAPKEPERALLLFCPAQDGWQVGKWSGGEWLTTAGVELALEPTHWTTLPVKPE
jgi:hypothetical protein